MKHLVVYKGMQKTFKAKVTNLLQEKYLKAQDASDESSEMSESEHSDELFDFLHEASNNTFQDSATKIFKSFVNQKAQLQLAYLLSNFQIDALKNLYI